MHQALTIERYMTRSVHSIGRDQTLRTAHDMMRKHRIRHLPVLEGGRLVGLVSLRDVMLVEGLPDVDATRVTVQEAMTQAPYAVPANAALGEVAQEMARRRIGSAVVVQRQKVIGIFTTVDALKALAETLGEVEALRGARSEPRPSAAV
jgi:acetoin utilization protein AcuB